MLVLRKSLKICLLIVFVLTVTTGASVYGQSESGSENSSSLPSVDLEYHENKLAFDLDFGFVVSSGIQNTIEDAYPGFDMTGGYGWLELGLGVRWEFTPQFSVGPGVSGMFNFGTGDVSFTNMVIVPQINFEYAFSPDSSFYVAGEVNYNLPDTNSNRLNFDSGGPGIGVAIGYKWSDHFRLEVGYLYLPVEVTIMSSGGAVVDERDENFGGFVFGLRGTF